MRSISQSIASALMMIVGAAAFTSCSLNDVSAKLQNATASSTASSSSQKSTNAAVQKSATTNSVKPATTVKPNSQTSETGKWQVTDQVPNEQVTDTNEPVRTQAQIDFEAASQALQNKQYARAIQLAAMSYQAAPSDEIRSFATYAASQLTPIELSNLESTITLPLEMAVIGQQRLNICASQQDNVCIAALLPATATALDAIGDTTAAERLRSMMTTAMHNTSPVVALLLPLSGTDRRIGRAMLGAILQAAGIYHHAPLPFDLRIFDTKSNAQTIPSIMQEVQNLGAKLILGPLDIKEIQAVIPKLSENQAVMVGFSPNDEFLKQTPSAFQFSYTLPLEAEQLAQTLVSLNARKVVAISPEDAYAAATVQELQNNLQPGTTLSTITFPATQTDLREIAKKVAQQSPDIVYLPTTADTAERIASFLAQENLWCKTPGSVAPNSKIDTRKFTVCIGSSAWAPIADNHRHKSLIEALYLDYTDAATSFNAEFATQFSALYHRQPAVQEVLPFAAVSMLKTLPNHVWQDSETLQTALYTLFKGQQYLILPSLRQITATGSQAFGMISTSAPILERSLSTAAH